MADPIGTTIDWNNAGQSSGSAAGRYHDPVSGQDPRYSSFTDDPLQGSRGRLQDALRSRDETDAALTEALRKQTATADPRDREAVDQQVKDLAAQARDARSSVAEWWKIYNGEVEKDMERRGVMTPEKRAILDAEVQQKYWDAQKAQLEVAKLLRGEDPRTIAADNEYKNADAAYKRAQIVLDQNKDLRDEMMLPYAMEASAAGASANRAQAAKSYSDIGIQEARLPFDIEQAKANATQTWENAGYTAAQAEELWQMIEAGMPQAKVENTESATAVNWENAANVRETTKQLTAGEKATRLNQIFQALEKGDISPTTAYNQYADVSSDSTRFEREKEANANAQNLLTAALNSGTLVTKGMTSMDPGGVLGRAMAGAGQGGADFALHPTGFGDFAQQTGIDIDPNVDASYTKQFQADLQNRIGTMQAAGQEVPAAYTAALGSGAPIDLTGRSPEEAVALIENMKRQGAGPAASSEQAQADLSQPAPAASPAPLHEDPGADAWWAGVQGDPVLAAASQHGEMSNAEPMGEATKVTYTTGQVLYFDKQGNEIDAPPAAVPATAAPVSVTINAAPQSTTAAAPATTPVSPAADPAGSYVPHVGPTGQPSLPNTSPHAGQTTTGAIHWARGGSAMVGTPRYMQDYVQRLRASRMGVR